MAFEMDLAEGSVEIESSTDTVEEVQAALGADVEESEPTEESAETETEPEAEAEAEAEAEPDAEEEESEADETNEEEEGESETEAEPEAAPKAGTDKPVKKAPPTVVSRKRLNEVIAQRNRYRQLYEDVRTAPAEPAAKVEDAESDGPESFSGQVEPRIEDYQNNEKYPDPYAAFTKDHGAWVRAETLAEVQFNRAQEEAVTERKKLVQGFNKTVKEALPRIPDYHERVKHSDVQISGLMERRVYKSPVGPDILVHFVDNPDEAAEISALDAEGQIEAMVELEHRFKAEIKPKANGTGTTTGPTKRIIPPPKKKSSAPPPPTRLKNANQPPRTMQELAGPEDKQGIDIDFNPEYERAVNALKKKR